MTVTEFMTNTNLHDLDFLSVILRLLLAVLFGGAIGMNRSISRHAAGFRTHILVCTGAALVMMTNQYMLEVLNYATDPARLGAQVITGVGFLGAGTILMRGNDNRVHGLTTAAGLWACACLGLAIGVGFYGAAITAGIIIFLSLAVFQRLGVKISNHFDQGEYEEEHTAYTQKRKARTASEDTGHRRHPRKTE